MPSILGYNRPRNIRESQGLSNQNTQVASVRGTAPWQGIAPDIDAEHIGPNSASTMKGLIPRTDISGRGEVLRAFPGFAHIDADYTDSSASSPARLGDHGSSSEDIVGLEFFPRVNAVRAVSGEFDDTTIAITAGNGIAPGSAQVWRVRPTTGLWQEIPHSGDAQTTAISGAYPDTPDGVQLCDIAVVAFDGSPRTNLSATAEGGPLMVFTNNHDPVQVYAVDEEPGVTDSQQNGDYEDLHVAVFGGGGGFKARSVELWGDRLNFLNTVEGGTRHRQRLRRTAIGNADPDSTNHGSGAFDFLDFSGEGLRVESLGNVLACYFEDGISFVRRTGQIASPYTVQTVTTERGLLATHALCNLGAGVHFGIFTDGWFYITENGQFKEVGSIDIEGVSQNKFTDTFYTRLQMDKRARIDCRYDAANKWVWITAPFSGADFNYETWILDIQSNRVFQHDIPVTKFGTSNIAISTATTVDNLSGSIDDLAGTVDSYGSRFGLSTLIHGTYNGMVFTHDDDSDLIINPGTGETAIPGWTYTTQLSGFGNPRHMHTVREVSLEVIPISTTPITVTLMGNDGELTQSRTFRPTSSDINKVRSITEGFRFSSQQFTMTISSGASHSLRSFDVDIIDTGSRRRV